MEAKKNVVQYVPLDKPALPPIGSQRLIQDADADKFQPAYAPTKTSNNPFVPGAVGPYEIIMNKFNYIVGENRLQAFYPKNRLEQIADKLARRVNFQKLASELHFSSDELVYEFVPLALYDVVILADNSGSMDQYNSQDGRLDDLKYTCSQIAKIMTLFDDDGISLRFLHGKTDTDGVTSVEKVNEIIKNTKFSGGTPIGEKLRSILDKYVTEPIRQNAFNKPVLIITITDGQPDSRDLVENVIINSFTSLSQTPYGNRCVGYEFAQVGRDKASQRWLDYLDNHKTIGNIIDVTSNYEAEQEQYSAKGCDLTPYMWLLKVCLGGIDPRYDAEDE